MSTARYHQAKVTGAKERCSSCELLNILGKPKFGQKRCKQCTERENKKKMQQKHVPVHLRQRSLSERTEKASRIMEEEAADAGESGILSGSAKPADDQEQASVSDILEIALELLDLVEAHVTRSGSTEEVQRFESQIRVLRKGRDAAKSVGHLEDKRAIILAFSIFTEHYTLLLRDFDRQSKKNQALKQLAYDTAGLVKKSEAQFESYVGELRSLQGQNVNVTQQSKIEMTKMRNEVTSLKLELNLRTNELRELQLEANAQSEELNRERERGEGTRKDKDSRITSLLAQMQQLSLDYAHEKSERLRLERENERLWTDRMAYRAEQIRSQHLSAAERSVAAEKDAIEKREWLEWKKKAALRDIASKERLREEAFDVRRGIETDAAQELERIRRELGEPHDPPRFDDARPSTINGRTKEQRAAERENARRESERQDRERDWWMENEQRPHAGAAETRIPAGPFAGEPIHIGAPSAAGANAQRWGARMQRQNEEEEIEQMIATLQARNEATSRRSLTNPAAPAYAGAPANDVIRAGSYSGGVDSVLANPRHSPAMPYFNDAPNTALTWQNPPAMHQSSRPANNYTSTNTHRSAVSYQPTSVASSIPPPVTAATRYSDYPQQPQAPQQSSAVTNDQLEEVQRQIDELKAASDRKTAEAEKVEKAARAEKRSSERHHERRVSERDSDRDDRTSKTRRTPSTELQAIEDGLRRSRQIRSESARVSATHASRTTVSSSTRRVQREEESGDDEQEDQAEDDREERKYSRAATSSRRERTSDRRSSSERESRSRSGDRESARESDRRPTRSDSGSEAESDADAPGSREFDGRKFEAVRDLTLYKLAKDPKK